MIRFCKNAYTTDSIRPKISVIKWKLAAGIGMTGISIITIAGNPKDVFDIYPIEQFKQRNMRKRKLWVIGIAESSGQANELASLMINDMHDVTGSYDNMRSYFIDFARKGGADIDEIESDRE